MRYILLVICYFFFFNDIVFAQNDSLSQATEIENISNADLKAKEILIDLSNPEDLELALKKIHTFKFLESVTLEGVTDESTLQKILYRLSVLKNLTSLTLKENELNKVPENIGNIKGLRSLTIEGNSNLDYNDLCSKLKSVQLSQLNLIDNDLKKTPASISEISSLKKVQLTGSNEVNYADFVDQLAKLPGLTTLSIPVNYITELPKNIEKLKSLQVLDVSNNTLNELPDEVSSLKAINNLSIQGNLLLDPVKDLAKLKGNNIQYLSLDKEIAGEDIEEIKKMFPNAEINFPPNNSDKEDVAAEDKKTEPPAPVKSIHEGELKAKNESSILSGAYLTYPALFQGVVYNFDTLGFEERYKDLRYTNIYRRVGNVTWGAGAFMFRKSTYKREKPGKKNEKWFRFSLENQIVSTNYPELRAFSGMYWVYQGELTKKQFKKKYLRKRQHVRFRLFKRSEPIIWNDIRIEFDNNNSLFTITVKDTNGFEKFNAYPVMPDIPIEKSQQMYNRRFLMYERALLRRTQNFKRDLSRNKNRYDLNYKRMKEYAWKELQIRMTDEEKAMSREEWLEYYDNIIANEQKAIDNTSLAQSYILRGLVLRGYSAGITNNMSRPIVPPKKNNANYGYRSFNVDFIDSKGAGKLAVSNIFILDNKNKTISQITGTLGISPNLIA
ncbi:MAG: leucine-rich repeat domain-containing protein, partial [Bacteroidia bacterium]